MAYRDLGLGDLLVAQGFRWAEAAKLLVIPTCPFVRRFLEHNEPNRECIVYSENEGLSKLMLPPATEKQDASLQQDGVE